MSEESSRRQRRATPKSVLEILLLTCHEQSIDKSRHDPPSRPPIYTLSQLPRDFPNTLEQSELFERCQLNHVTKWSVWLRPRITDVFHRSDWTVETNYSACSEEIT